MGKHPATRNIFKTEKYTKPVKTKTNLRPVQENLLSEDSAKELETGLVHLQPNNKLFDS